MPIKPRPFAFAALSVCIIVWLLSGFSLASARPAPLTSPLTTPAAFTSPLATPTVAPIFVDRTSRSIGPKTSRVTPC